MLRWECVVRSLLLGAVFMTALGARTQTCSRTEDGSVLITKILKEEPTLVSGTMLYTPTEEHYQSCPGFTLSCMKTEMEMLLDEWNISGRLRRIIKIINKNIPKNQTQTQTSGCVRCEHFPEASAEVFLDFLNSTFQLINSECNTTS